MADAFAARVDDAMAGDATRERANASDDDGSDDGRSTHSRQLSAASTLERADYTQYRLDASAAFERFEEPGPLDGDLEFEKLGSARAAVLNLVASFRVFSKFLITAESVIVAAISVASALFFILYEVRGRRMAVNLSWTFVSFAIIYPLTGSLDAAFRRREEALKQLAVFKTSVLSFYQGHRDWDWGDNGRKNLPEKHVEEVRWLAVALVCDVRNFLSAPEVTRLVHLNTKRGRVAWSKGRKLQWAIAKRVRELFQKMSLTTEVLKYAGMPGNESARLRQFTKEGHNALENMCFLKTYRTPMATRAFARVYILIHPIFWGPYYAQLVSDILHDEAAGYDPADQFDVPSYTRYWVIFYACCMSVITSLAMLGLFNVRYSLEDPFATKERNSNSGQAGYESRYIRGVDQVLIYRELRDLVNDLCLEFDHRNESSVGGPPNAIYPLKKRSQLQNITVTEDLVTPSLAERQCSKGRAPDLDRIHSIYVPQ